MKAEGGWHLWTPEGGRFRRNSPLPYLVIVGSYLCTTPIPKKKQPFIDKQLLHSALFIRLREA